MYSILASLLFSVSVLRFTEYNLTIPNYIYWNIEPIFTDGYYGPNVFHTSISVFYFHLIGIENNRRIQLFSPMNFDGHYFPCNPLFRACYNPWLYTYLQWKGYDQDTRDPEFLFERPIDRRMYYLEKNDVDIHSYQIKTRLANHNSINRVYDGIPYELWETIMKHISHDYRNFKFSRIVYNNRIFDTGPLSLSHLSSITVEALFRYPNQSVTQYISSGRYEKDTMLSNIHGILFFECIWTDQQSYSINISWERGQTQYEGKSDSIMDTIYSYRLGYWMPQEPVLVYNKKEWSTIIGYPVEDKNIHDDSIMLEKNSFP